MDINAKNKLKAHRKARKQMDALHAEALKLDKIRTAEFARIRPLRGVAIMRMVAS